MRQLNFPLLQSLIAIIIGIIAYDYFQIDLKVILSITAGLLLLLFIAHRYAGKISFSEIPFIIGTTALFITLGYATRERSNDLKDSSHYTYYKNLQDTTILVSIDEQLKPTLYQNKFVTQVQTIDSLKSSGRLLLNLSKDSLTSLPKIGEWYYIRSQILPLPQPKNPYQFDYGNYLKNQQIYGQLSLDPSALLKSENTSTGLKVWSSRFRESVQSSLRSYPFSRSQLAIMEALILGQKQGIDKEMSTQYAAAGMMHILAVSGLHVGIVLLILRFLTRPLSSRKFRWLRSGVIVVLIWAFAFVTGLSPSVLRAATMFSFLEIGSSLGGKRKTHDAVIASALLLLLYDPLLIYQVGFQLSYLAVIAILWIQPWLSSFYSPRFWLDGLLWGTATVTLAAQLGVMPLSLFYFHQFPGLFFISNIVVLPFLAFVLGAGIFVTVLAIIGYLPPFIISAYGGVIDMMNGFIGWVASQESFVSKHISVSIAFLIGSYVLIIIIISLFKKFTFARLLTAAIAISLMTSLWVYERSHPPASHLAILNKSKSTALLAYEAGSLRIFHNDSLFDPAKDYNVNAYRDALSIDAISVESIQDYFRFKQKELLVIDSLGVYKLANAQPAFILLTQSPKINLDRLIDLHPQAHIIADASNYKSYVDRWRKTCLKRKIPFHSTYEKGAFLIE